MPGRKRIMMISTHGYVSAEPELGRPDTGGQVVYVLELSKCLGRMGFQVDILTDLALAQAGQLCPNCCQLLEATTKLLARVWWRDLLHPSASKA